MYDFVEIINYLIKNRIILLFVLISCFSVKICNVENSFYNKVYHPLYTDSTTMNGHVSLPAHAYYYDKFPCTRTSYTTESWNQIRNIFVHMSVLYFYIWLFLAANPDFSMVNYIGTLKFEWSVLLQFCIGNNIMII